MSYLVLSRKYRPKSFHEVVGQPHIVTTLVHALQTNRVSHAYLFAGPRGVGKTSMARILAKALNCQNGPTDEPCMTCSICNSIATGNDIDVLEIDGASNRGIDEVRSIRQNVRYRPAVGRYKIYIIDEVHMLTKEAFNAILKTLEEPPEHVKFFFATTSPNRVPDTVQSRCQRFDFKNISIADISNRLTQICKAENILTDDGVLQTVAKYAKGGLRDSESLLDQLASFCYEKITFKNVYDVLGIVDEEILTNIIDSFIEKNPKLALKALHEISESGKNVEGFIDQLLLYIRDLLLVSICDKDSRLIDTTARDITLLQKQASSLSSDSLMYMIQLLTETKNKMNDVLQQMILLEVVFIKLATMEDLTPLSTVLERIEDMKQLFEKDEHITKAETALSKNSVTKSKKGAVNEETPSNNADRDEDITHNTGLDNIWDKTLTEIQRKKKMLWALLRNSKLLTVDNKEAVLELPANYLIHKKRLEKQDEKQLIEKCLEKVMGNKIQVRLTISKNRRRIVTENEGYNRESLDVSGKNKEEVMNEPMVKKTTDMLNGAIVNIRRRT
ncbi:MAG: DNA polymerase III subunit gamma/tau [Candidatus Scalindua sp.]|nr:DNA polymerase III subunit gamma/tau [Candidatus Scalindua sp.]